MWPRLHIWKPCCLLLFKLPSVFRLPSVYSRTLLWLHLQSPAILHTHFLQNPPTIVISLSTLPNVFSKSTKAKHKFLFLLPLKFIIIWCYRNFIIIIIITIFFCICLTVMMASAVHFPSLHWNCVSPNFLLNLSFKCMFYHFYHTPQQLL